MRVATGQWSQGGLSSGIGGWAPRGDPGVLDSQGRGASPVGTRTLARPRLLLNSRLPGAGPGVPTLSWPGPRPLRSCSPPLAQNVLLWPGNPRLSVSVRSACRGSVVDGPGEPPPLLECHASARLRACLRGQGRACSLRPLLLARTGLSLGRPQAQVASEGGWGERKETRKSSRCWQHF